MTAPLTLCIRRTRPEADRPASVALRMRSEIAEVETAVELMVRHCFAGQPPSSRAAFCLRVTLAEALANAIQKGNREDPAKRVFVKAELFDQSIRLEVADEGRGFIWPQPFPPSLPESLEDECGRGLFIISRLAERVEFNETGNVIWMTLPRC